MRANATRMQLAVAFVEAHPGATSRAVTLRLLEDLDDLARERPTAYKQAASVVDRVIRDRLVRQDSDLRLHPWNVKRKAYAEALERAAFVAPDRAHFLATLDLARAAWRDAGDENRARILAARAHDGQAAQATTP